MIENQREMASQPDDFTKMDTSATLKSDPTNDRNSSYVLVSDIEQPKKRRRSWPPLAESRDSTPGIFIALDEDLSSAVFGPESESSKNARLQPERLGSEKRNETSNPNVTCQKLNESEILPAPTTQSSNTRTRILDDGNSAGTVTSARTLRKRRIASIFQHYYPEGGWGYVVLITSFLVHLIANGLPFCFVLVLPLMERRFRVQDITSASLLGVVSLSFSLLISPLVIAVCRRKSTRLTSVIGGLITALGCLFTSFATEFHQLFISFGIIVGIGVAMSRDPASLMVGQYFKRRRAFVEIFLVSSSGLGMALVSTFERFSVDSLGWRLGLQITTVLTFLLFILGTFFRSASLYHPQRRAILHLKSQKRKIKNKDKEKNKSQDDRPPFFDFSTLRSKTVRILLCSIGIGSFGLNVPLFNIVQQATKDGLRGRHLIWLQIHLGISWAIGCFLFGAVTVNNSIDCRISKQYLCQGALFMTGIAILAFTAAEGINGYVMFAWIYGIFNGGYNYSLKMYINEKVRARNFARAWSFAQFSMAVPNLVGVPLSGYLDSRHGQSSGLIFSGVMVILGSMVMILIDVHRRSIRRRKHKCKTSQAHKAITQSLSISQDNKDPNYSYEKQILNAVLDLDLDRNSFTDQDDILPPVSLLSHQRSFVYDDLQDLLKKHDSLCSEEGMAELDLPEEYLMEDYDYVDNITSCNKVENYLMLSEYEQNLIKETEGPNMDGPRKWNSRKWSMFKAPTMPTINSETEEPSVTNSGSAVMDPGKTVSEVSESSGDFFRFSKKSFRSKTKGLKISLKSGRENEM